MKENAFEELFLGYMTINRSNGPIASMNNTLHQHFHINNYPKGQRDGICSFNLF